MLATTRVAQAFLRTRVCAQSLYAPITTTGAWGTVMARGMATGGLQSNDPFNNIPDNVVSKVGRNLHQCDNHPINTIKIMIEDYFRKLDTKFDFVDDKDPVVTVKANFDDLLTPEDHVSRSPNDTYYVDKDHVLRCHTSAHQNELLLEGKRSFLCTGDVYRRDSIDASHGVCFHQMEGVRVFVPESPHDSTEAVEEVVSDLKYTLNGMVRHLFGDVKVRWVDAYFPFTDPSFELEIFFNGEWLEVLGCGAMQQQILKNCKLGDHRGWAFGLGLDRLAMVLFNIPDIRLFWTEDERFHSQFKRGEITQFTPYSKYPPCFKDVSFWVPTDHPFHENSFYELVRDVAGDLVENAEEIDNFKHPKTHQHSLCYRITYRSMTHSLTNDEINTLQDEVRIRLERDLHVTLR